MPYAAYIHKQRRAYRRIGTIENGFGTENQVRMQTKLLTSLPALQTYKYTILYTCCSLFPFGISILCIYLRPHICARVVCIGYFRCRTLRITPSKNNKIQWNRQSDHHFGETFSSVWAYICIQMRIRHKVQTHRTIQIHVADTGWNIYSNTYIIHKFYLFLKDAHRQQAKLILIPKSLDCFDFSQNARASAAWATKLYIYAVANVFCDCVFPIALVSISPSHSASHIPVSHTLDVCICFILILVRLIRPLKHPETCSLILFSDFLNDCFRMLYVLAIRHARAYITYDMVNNI